MNDDNRPHDFESLEPPLEAAVKVALAGPIPEDAVERVKVRAKQLAATTVSPSRAFDSHIRGLVAFRSFKPRRILMKSLLAIAASLAACVALWLAVEGNHNSLYAQVVDAARKARTIHIIHYEQRKEETEPIKTWESWYESGVGFRREVWDWKHTAFRQCIFGNEDSTWTLDNDQKQTAIRSRGRGITKETEQIFSDIERHAQELQNHGQSYPEGDQVFDGQPCKAYLSKTDKRRQLYYLDQQSRLVRVVSQEQEGDRWNTTQFNTIGYDKPLDSALFQPNFGKDFKIVDADAKPAKPTKPEGQVLIYEVDPNSKPANTTTIDMDKLLKVVDGRLNAGSEKLAVVRKLDDRRIEVTLMRRNDADRQRVERQLTRPGTLEFRVLANNHVDKALIDRAQMEPARSEVLGPSGKRLAWWVPVKAGEERSFAANSNIARPRGSKTIARSRKSLSSPTRAT